MYRSAILTLLVCLSAAAQTQSKGAWADWGPFLGTWQATGGGDPGSGRGEFIFAPDLQGAVLIRHNYAEYPANKDKPAYRHDDLMVIYRDAANQTRADYWDSEGHFIHYQVELSPTKLVFLSDAREPGPRYRLTYAKTSQDTVKITFEIAPPGDPTSFKTYIEASGLRSQLN